MRETMTTALDPEDGAKEAQEAQFRSMCHSWPVLDPIP